MEDPFTPRLRASLQRMHARELIVFPCAIGVLTGAAAIGFVELVNLVQWLAVGSADLPLHVLPRLAWYHVLLVPAAGGLVVGPLVRFLAPETEGHGVPEVIEAVMVGGGRIRRRVAAVKSIASAVTIGTGGSVGREGPIVQIGAAVGSAVGQLFALPAAQLKTFAACGAAGGIAAVFNAPIAGAFFALEVISGNFAMPTFSPVILSSVLATVVSRAYFGDRPAFIVQPYALVSIVEIAAYAGLGIVCGAVAVLFVRTMDGFETAARRVPVPKAWWPAAGGLGLGAMVLAVPNVYGVGYATMDAALRGDVPWAWLCLLVPAKMVATSLTLASGGSGGVFLPALYVGAAAGGAYGAGARALLGGLAAGPGAYALVGMAGVLAAATHAPITAIILLLEVSGDYKIILPVMIVSTLATLVARALHEQSLYTLKLSRRGLDLHRREDLVMRSHTVGEITRPAAWVVHDGTPLDELIRDFLEREAMVAYVTEPAGRFAGTISIHDIKNPEVRQLGPLVVARDLALANIPTVAPGDTLADCMERFVFGESDELPVVDAGRLCGVVSRRDVLRIYSSELLRHEYVGVAARAEGGRGVRLAAGFTLARVPVPAGLAGRSLREANLRAAYNLTVVAVRGRAASDDRLPDPEVPLGADDVLVIAGRPADIDRFRRTLGRPPAAAGGGSAVP
jgi:CIC family chloride channel protein